MPDIKEFLPLLIPLIAVEFILLGYTLYHIVTHKTYRRGSRGLWKSSFLFQSQLLNGLICIALSTP